MTLWDAVNPLAVSFYPSNIKGIVSTVNGAIVLNFIPASSTINYVKWELRDGDDTDIIVHAETLAAPSTLVTNHGGNIWVARCEVGQYATSGKSYVMYFYAYPTGDDSLPLLIDATAYAPPSVTILTPADHSTVTDLPVGISWTVSDATGVSEQVAALTVGQTYDSARVLWSGQSPEFDQDTRAIALDSVDVPFEDGEDYFFYLRVTNGVGLKSVAGITFAASWVAPVTPTATVTTDPDTLAASVTVTAGEATSATNVGEFFAHSLTDSSYWYSTNFSAATTAAGNGWAHITYTNSGSSWGYMNVSPKAAKVSLTASTTYTYLVEVKNLVGSIRVIAPSTSGTTSVWSEGTNTDFTEDGAAYVTATTLADMSSATMVRTYLGVPANSTVTCDIRLSLYAGEYDGPYVPYNPPATDTLMVVRVSPDGTRHVLADGLESGDTVTDPLPPLGVEYSYEVTGIAATGVPSTAAIVPVTINTGAWALNFGEHAEECVLFRYNPTASYDIEHGGELYHFADGGANGGLPQWYGTTDRDESGSISWNTVDRSRAMRLHDLSLAHPVGWIRDPYGRSWYARIAPSMSHERTRVLKVSINWNKVVWKEP